MTQINNQVILAATRQSNMFDLVNAIRNSSSSYFQEFVPLANWENIAEVGKPLTTNVQLRNEFIEALVNRIGLVIMRHVTLSNPLARFKSGTMELGDTIEEIFTDLTSAHIYDVAQSEEEVFKREIPNVQALYHKLNRKEFYKQTIQEKSLQQAFISWDKFGSFVASIVQAMHNSAAVDEYKYMKELLTLAYAEGHFKMVRLDHSDSTPIMPSDYVEKARAYAMKLTLPMGSREYNSLGVHTKTDPSDLIILMTADLAARIDVNVLASAFNMDKASFIGQRIILDSLFKNPETLEEVEMMLIDKNFFMVFEHTLQMTNQYNPQGLYWNQWLHVWQTMSYSRFANCVAFVKGGVNPISEIVLTPALTTIAKGANRNIITNIRYVDSEYPVNPEFTLTYKAIANGVELTSTDVVLTPDAITPQIVKVAVQAATTITEFDVVATLTTENPSDPDNPFVFTAISKVTVS